MEQYISIKQNLSFPSNCSSLQHNSALFGGNTNLGDHKHGCKYWPKKWHERKPLKYFQFAKARRFLSTPCFTPQDLALSPRLPPALANTPDNFALPSKDQEPGVGDETLFYTGKSRLSSYGKSGGENHIHNSGSNSGVKEHMAG